MHVCLAFVFVCAWEELVLTDGLLSVNREKLLNQERERVGAVPSCSASV